MKYLCCFLSLFVLLVSTAPCCSDACGDKEGKAAQGNQTGQQHPDEEAGGKTCSPFLTCGACSGFINPVPSHISVLEVTSHRTPWVDAYQLASYPFIPATFWQPPKIS